MAPPPVSTGGEVTSTPAMVRHGTNSDGSSDSLIMVDGVVQRHVVQEDGSSPLPLNGIGKDMKLKKGSLWGSSNGDPAGLKPHPPPSLGIVGCSFNGDGTPRPPSTRGRKPPSGEGAGAPPRSPAPRKSGGGLCNGAALATPGSGAGTTPGSLSAVTLTLDTPISSRRLVSAAAPIPAIPLPPHQQQVTPILKSGGNNMRSPPAMRLDTSGSSAPPFPPDTPPDGMRRGGGEELEWLQSQHAEAKKLYAQLAAQLQRVMQESIAIRSSLLAQQTNNRAGAEAEAGASLGASLESVETGGDQVNGSLRGGTEFSPRTEAALAGGGLPRPPAPLARGLTSLQLRNGGAEREATAGPKARSHRKAGRGRREGDEEEATNDAIVHVHQKSDEVSRRMIATLSKKAPFEGHDEVYLTQLVAAMAPVEVEGGVDVITEGETGDLAYWVEEGELTVRVGDKEVDTIKRDTVFGEVALVYDLPRTASIRAKGKCAMWMLHRAMFQHILRDKAISERKATFIFLKTVKIFASLSGREISRIADVVESVNFEAEKAIITEGEDADAMYIVQEGQAVVSQSLDEVPSAAQAASGEEGEKALLRILKAGDYFGERALLEDQKRSATVTAASKVTLLRIDKTTFRDLLGGLRAELIKRAPADRRRDTLTSRPGDPMTPSPMMMRNTNGASPANQRGSESGSHDASPSMSRSGAQAPKMVREAPRPSDLTASKPLGSGGYGRVALVKHKKTKRLYALKRVCKAHLLAHNGAMRCEWLAREKRILASLEHPFIVSLHGTYADNDSIYLLLSAAMGGDLYRLIEKLGTVPERVARFYISSLVLALDHIHSQEVVYRDLKPENVLLDAQGYVKICDFGFAKKISDRTYTRCGTPDYTAPEMLLNQGVNQACDWWALGILIFEMLVGVPPFTDSNGDDMKTYQNITHGALSSCYPEDAKVTDEGRALIQGLCTVKVAYRLGYLKGGADDVMAHAWFEGYDWDGLVNLTKEPPWRPHLQACDDTQCFDDAASGDSLDGPPSKQATAADLLQKWQSLQDEYTGGGKLHSMGHLTTPA